MIRWFKFLKASSNFLESTAVRGVYSGVFCVNSTPLASNFSEDVNQITFFYWIFFGVQRTKNQRSQGNIKKNQRRRKENHEK